MAKYTYLVSYYNKGWRNAREGLSLKEAYKFAYGLTRSAKWFPEIKDIIVTHEQYGHIVLQFDATTRELTYWDLG